MGGSDKACILTNSLDLGIERECMNIKSFEEQKAYSDLATKVEQLFEADKNRALQRLDRLVKSGAGVLQDHQQNDQDFVTAIHFVEAYRRDASAKFPRAEEKIIKNYALMM